VVGGRGGGGGGDGKGRGETRLEAAGVALLEVEALGALGPERALGGLEPAVEAAEHLLAQSSQYGVR
jgi:hypothetical protein